MNHDSPIVCLGQVDNEELVGPCFVPKQGKGIVYAALPKVLVLFDGSLERFGRVVLPLDLTDFLCDLSEESDVLDCLCHHLAFDYAHRDSLFVAIESIEYYLSVGLDCSAY